MGRAPPVAMNLAVVGGGWAGLSAAVTALKLGHRVNLFESSTALGGRARTVHAPALGCAIDNGQHLLLGAYEATLTLMRELGCEPAHLFHRLPLSIVSADGQLSLRAPAGLPAPWHLAWCLMTAKGMSVTEKALALRAMSALQRQGWRTQAGTTVRQWLDAMRQPATLQARLWHPLCIATLNTPPDIACAQLFATVLRDSLGAADRNASDMLIPRVTLSELWPERVADWAETRPLAIHRSTTVRRITPTRTVQGDPAWQLDVSPTSYDAVILCGNTPSVYRLVEPLPPTQDSAPFLEQLQAFRHAPIATLTLKLDAPLQLPAPMLLLHEDRTRDHFGQWLFQGQDPTGCLLHVVVSDAESVSTVGRERTLAGITKQLQEQLAGLELPAITGHALITEKRATFLAVPGLRRPGNATPWPRLMVAGDWTDTGYPAVLEGAVRSGRDAALRLGKA